MAMTIRSLLRGDRRSEQALAQARHERSWPVDGQSRRSRRAEAARVATISATSPIDDQTEASAV
jgi:hypothetical protein